jgi:hypothetical protein
LDVQLGHQFKHYGEYFFLTGDRQLVECALKILDLFDNESEDLAHLLELPQKRSLSFFGIFYLQTSDFFHLELRNSQEDA